MGSHGYNNAHDDLYEKSAFTAEMSSKMQVPKRISVLGGNNNRIDICYFIIFYFAQNMAFNQEPMKTINSARETLAQDIFPKQIPSMK